MRTSLDDFQIKDEGRSNYLLPLEPHTDAYLERQKMVLDRQQTAIIVQQCNHAALEERSTHESVEPSQHVGQKFTNMMTRQFFRRERME